MVGLILLHIIAALLWFYMFRTACADVGVGFSYRHEEQETVEMVHMLHTTRNIYRRRRIWVVAHAIVCVGLGWTLGSDPQLIWMVGPMLKGIAVMLIISTLFVDSSIRNWIPYAERFEA